MIKFPNETPAWIQHGESVDGSMVGDSSGPANRPALNIFENQIALNEGKSDLYQSVTIYLSPSGSDVTGDGTAANPYATPHHVITLLSGEIDRYSEVVLDFEAGTYSFNTKLSILDFKKGSLIFRGKNSSLFNPSVILEFDDTGWVDDGDLQGNNTSMVDIFNSIVNFEYLHIRPSNNPVTNNNEILTVRNKSTLNFLGLKLELGHCANMLVETQSLVRGYLDPDNYFRSVASEGSPSLVVGSNSKFIMGSGEFYASGGATGVIVSNSSLALVLSRFRIEGLQVSGGTEGLIVRDCAKAFISSGASWDESSVGGQCYITSANDDKPSILVDNNSSLSLNYPVPSTIGIDNYACYLGRGLCIHNRSTVIAYGVRLHFRPINTHTLHLIHDSSFRGIYNRLEGNGVGVHSLNGSNAFLSNSLVQGCSTALYSAYSGKVQTVGVNFTGNTSNSSPAFNSTGNYDSYNTNI